VSQVFEVNPAMLVNEVETDLKALTVQSVPQDCKATLVLEDPKVAEDPLALTVLMALTVNEVLMVSPVEMV
jgi:DNA polymerase III psi subunit